MMREIISNDSLTIILFTSIFILIILKKLDPILFNKNFKLKRQGMANKIPVSFLGIKTLEIHYNLLFISNLSILLALFKNQNFDLNIYFNLLKYLSVFFISKIIFDLAIGKLFKINKIMKNYVWKKLVYSNSLGILLLIFNFIIAYTIFYKYEMITIFIYLAISYLIFTYSLIFFSMKKVIIKNWFYFILYLCTLEIIPYYYLISNVL